MADDDLRFFVLALWVGIVHNTTSKSALIPETN